MKIYIAGPFFTKEECHELEEMIQYVRELYPNSELFIPKEHFIPDGETMPNDVWAKKVFDMDVQELDDADLVFALYLGHYSDTGTAWEIGYAYAREIPVLLYCPKINSDVSIMPFQSAEVIRFNKQLYNQK